MKDLITDLHKQYSNRMLSVREATCLLVINSYICSNNIGRLAIINNMLNEQQFSLSMPNLMYEPMYEQWHDRVNIIACGNNVDRMKLVELFKQYLPSALADTPLLKYFGKSTTTTTTTVQHEDKLQIQHIKPNLRTLGQYVFECTNGKEADKKGFLLETAYSGLLADYLWQELQHVIGITPDTSITIGNLKKAYTMNDNTATWIRMVVDFMKVCYSTKKKLSATDFCSLIQGLDSNNTRNEKESTFYEALPSELKLRVMK